MRRGLANGSLSLAAAVLLSGTFHPAAAQERPERRGGFVRIEQWACPGEEGARFLDFVESVWVPIFDEMTRQGHFIAWRSLRPVEARRVDFKAGDAAVSRVEEPWTWVGIWTGETQRSFEDAWREYHRRLGEQYPDAPNPAALCDNVRIATYDLR